MILQAEPDLTVVGEAADGRAAIAVVNQVNPDVVLTDVRMPGMGGIEATRRLRCRWPDLRVIVLSVYADEVERALAAGAERFLLKGSPAAEIVGAIRQPSSARVARACTVEARGPRDA